MTVLAVQRQPPSGQLYMLQPPEKKISMPLQYMTVQKWQHPLPERLQGPFLIIPYVVRERTQNALTSVVPGF